MVQLVLTVVPILITLAAGLWHLARCIGNLQNSVDQLMEDTGANEDRINRLDRQEISSLRKDVAVLSETLASLQEKVSKLEEKIDRLYNRLNSEEISLGGNNGKE